MSSLMNGGAESEVVIVIFCERSLPRAAAAGTFPNIGQYFRTMSSTNVPRTLVCELSLSSRELWLFPLKKIHFSRRSRVFANSEGREKRGKGGEKEGKEEKREGRRITVAVKLMMVLMRYL
jgi:hypothetical protein